MFIFHHKTLAVENCHICNAQETLEHWSIVNLTLLTRVSRDIGAYKQPVIFFITCNFFFTLDCPSLGYGIETRG